MSVKSAARAVVDYVAVHRRLVHYPGDALVFVQTLAQLVDSLHLELAVDADRAELAADLNAFRATASALKTPPDDNNSNDGVLGLG